MRYITIFLIALLLFLNFTSAILADEIKTTVEVLANSQNTTSLSIISEDSSKAHLTNSQLALNIPESSSLSTSKIVDIEQFEIRQLKPGGHLNASMVIKNLSENSLILEQANLSVNHLDGTDEISDSIKTNEVLSPAVTKSLQFEFPGGVKPGDYIAKISIFSQGKLVGESKSILSIKPVSPQVLGASTVNYFSPEVIIFIVISMMLIMAIFSIKYRLLLTKTITIRLFDFFAVIMGISAFSTGLFGGYYLCKVLDGKGISPFRTDIVVTDAARKSDNTLAAEASDIIKFVYRQKALVLYSKPDTSSGKVEELKSDTDLKIIDQAAGWYRVELENGNSGWVRIKELTIP